MARSLRTVIALLLAITLAASGMLFGLSGAAVGGHTGAVSGEHTAQNHAAVQDLHVHAGSSLEMPGPDDTRDDGGHHDGATGEPSCCAMACHAAIPPTAPSLASGTCQGFAPETAATFDAVPMLTARLERPPRA